jgi:hypothetical protein
MRTVVRIADGAMNISEYKVAIAFVLFVSNAPEPMFPVELSGVLELRAATR